MNVFVLLLCGRNWPSSSRRSEGHASPAWALTCGRFLLGRSWRDPPQGHGEHAQASEVLRGVLDEPGEAAVDLKQRGGAILDQLQRVPLAVREQRFPNGPLHLPQHAHIGNVVDVAVPQLRSGRNTSET